ncbi:hypothetical protein R3P38DRAFT_2867670 [Favolaschia claudopus]|uniref:F-box domain-containing protein n=1 Tax=Favolaschia claudopus TaxID=2862362 RepID=A0AAW0D9T6_9AGAR
MLELAKSETAFTRPPLILSLPPNVSEQLLSYCGPLTLQILLLVCRAFREFLVKERSITIWRAARSKLLFDVALPSTGRRSSELALATLMFGTRKCFNCGRPTVVMHHSFTLDIRLCSWSCELVALQKVVVDDSNKHSPDPAIMPYTIKTLIHAKSLPGHYLHLEGTTAYPLYKRAQIDAAKDLYFGVSGTFLHHELGDLKATPTTDTASVEWSQAAEKLIVCSRAYKEAKAAIDLHHEAFIQNLATIHDRSFEHMLTSPTLTRHINAFARDLEVFGPAAWETLQPLVLEEIRLRTPDPSGKTVCLFCPHKPSPRRHTNHGFAMHLQSKHPEQIAEKIVLSVQLCSLCPRATRTYSRDNLVKHLKNSHRMN